MITNISFKSRILRIDVVKNWMSQLEELLTKYNFPPFLIFNMDETMVDAGGHKMKVITRSKSPRPFTENEGKTDHITFALCVSASGGYVQPLCILPLKTLPHLEEEILQFFAISGQENGFISNEIWHQWVEKVLIPHINRLRQQHNIPNQPALLIVDSHSTRKHEPTIRLFEAHNIIVFILPAHSSTILQPLDLSCNKEFKRVLRQLFHVVPNEDRPTKRNRLLFTSIHALQSAFVGHCIQLGFRRAGIHPFSSQAPLNSHLIRNPLAERNFSPPLHHPKRNGIAGKVITHLNSLLALPSSKTLVITIPQQPITPIYSSNPSSEPITTSGISVQQFVSL